MEYQQLRSALREGPMDQDLLMELQQLSEDATPSQLMHDYTSTWAVAGDASDSTDTPSLWLLNDGGPWLGFPILKGIDPHRYADASLLQAGLAGTRVLHSASWFVSADDLALTFIGVVEPRGLVLDQWPTATPLVAGAVEPAIPHSPTEPATPSDQSICAHAVCHLAWLLTRDLPIGEELRRLGLAPLLELWEPLPAFLFGGRHIPSSLTAVP